MEDKDSDSHGAYIAEHRIISTLFSGSAYRISDTINFNSTSKFIFESELPTRGKMKFENDSEFEAIKLALRESELFDFYIWVFSEHLYWNTDNVKNEYPFQLYPFGDYFRIKSEYKGWKIGNQYGI